MSKTFVDYLRLQHPQTGRTIAEDGSIVNFATEQQRSVLSLRRGEYPGAESFDSDGECDVTGAVNNVAIWPGTAVLPDPLSSGVAMTVTSTSDADSVAGAGARYLFMTYLDNSLNRRSTMFPTNGIAGTTTPVEDIRWIQTLTVVAADLTGTRAAVGTITASYGGTVYATIPAGNLIQASSFRMVPRGYKAHARTILLSSASATADAKAFIRTVVWTDGLLIPGGSIAVQNGGLAIDLPMGYPLLPGTLLGLSASSNKSLTATGMFVGWIEPA